MAPRGVGRGCPPPHRGRGLGRGYAPSPENFVYFGCQIGNLWCIPYAFFTVQINMLIPDLGLGVLGIAAEADNSTRRTMGVSLPTGRVWGGGCAPPQKKFRFWMSNRQLVVHSL